MSKILLRNTTEDESPKKKYEMTPTQKETAEWLGTMRWEYFITLTFEVDVSEAEAKRQYSIFTKCLNQRIYGRRSNRKIHQVAAMEYTINGRIHIHILMGKQTKFNHEEFMDQIYRGWTHSEANYERAKCMTKSDGWFSVLSTEKDSTYVLNYNLKFITNPCRLDRLIIEEINLPIAP